MEQWLGVLRMLRVCCGAVARLLRMLRVCCGAVARLLRMLRVCCGAVARCASYAEGVSWSSGSVCID